MPKNKVSDKILTIIFVVSILMGFYLVSMVNASFENDKENVLLFESNSAINFLEIEITDLPFNTFNFVSSGYYLNLDSESFYNYTKNPVYLGNDTWSMSINGSSHNNVQYAKYVIELDELPNWLISDITLNLTKNTDSDLAISWAIYSINTLNEYKYLDGDKFSTIVYSDILAGSTSIYYNKTANINLATSLDIYDKALDGVQHFIVIRILDVGSDGLDSWAWNINMVIEGKQIDTYNIMQQLNMSLIIAIIINVFVIIFMTDKIDVGGFKNDIPNIKKR